MHCVAHAVAPFRSSKTWADDIEAVFVNALSKAFDEANADDVVVPLLGAGARGAKEADVAGVAAKVLNRWLLARSDVKAGKEQSDHHSSSNNNNISCSDFPYYPGNVSRAEFDDARPGESVVVRVCTSSEDAALVLTSTLSRLRK